MNLNELPQVVTWPETHYVFVEKTGPFQEIAPQAWKDAHTYVPEILVHNQITGYLSLYKVEPRIYRAGFALAAVPVQLPEGMQCEVFNGGNYSKFVLTGPYSDLAAASGRVAALVTDLHLPVRDDFFIENYVNDPRTTPENELITEILVPIR